MILVVGFIGAFVAGFVGWVVFQAGFLIGAKAGAAEMARVIALSARQTVAEARPNGFNPNSADPVNVMATTLSALADTIDPDGAAL